MRIVQRSSSNSIALATGQNCPYDVIAASPLLVEPAPCQNVFTQYTPVAG